ASFPPAAAKPISWWKTRRLDLADTIDRLRDRFDPYHSGRTPFRSAKNPRSRVADSAHRSLRVATTCSRLCGSADFDLRVAMNTKQEKYFYILIASLFVSATLTLAAQKKSTPTAPSVFTQDKGKFTIQLEGQTIGHEEFEIAPAGGGWTARGTTDLQT